MCEDLHIKYLEPGEIGFIVQYALGIDAAGDLLVNDLFSIVFEAGAEMQVRIKRLETGYKVDRHSIDRDKKLND